MGSLNFRRIALGLCVLLGLANSSHAEWADPGSEITELVKGHAYRVSTYFVAQLRRQTSEIFLFRGPSDARFTRVWVYSTGIGDPQGDSQGYLKFFPLRNALADAQDVKRAITQGSYLGLAANRVTLGIIVPHGHLDHINAELPTALESLGLRTDVVYVHQADHFLATCNQPFCGDSPSLDSPYAGAPYDKAWTNPWLDRFVPFGSPDDHCGHSSLTLQTQALGPLVLQRDYDGVTEPHTPGTVNLLLPESRLAIRHRDSEPQVCPPPRGLRWFALHRPL